MIFRLGFVVNDYHQKTIGKHFPLRFIPKIIQSLNENPHNSKYELSFNRVLNPRAQSVIPKTE